MPPVVRKGDIVGKYTIEEELGRGAFAMSFRARGPAGTVFLKQYKMPTIATAWYRAYVQYQAEIKKRVESTSFKSYSYRFIDFFEHNIGITCYFQVFEFAERGKNLTEIINELKTSATAKSWSQRVILAKVLTAGLRALHEARIVHTDLKPDNIQLFYAPHIEAGYTLKIIDLDFAILAGMRAPWHAATDFTYVGTPAYQSPEHLDGRTPIVASDMFTAGLMLYELLAGAHPYSCDSDEEYAAKARAYRVSPPTFPRPFPPPADSREIAGLIHRCLSPDPAKRPTAQQVHEALNGLRTPAPPPPRPGSPEPPPPVQTHQGTIALIGDKGRMESRVTLALGRGNVRQVSSEADFWGSEQAILNKTAAGWEIQPCKGTKNATLLNGGTLSAPKPLKAGDVIAVGRASTHVTKGSLEVTFG